MTKKKPQTVKLQHYVPQFYLRNFSVKKGKNNSIYCFDKFEDREFRQNVKNIACENYFYEDKGKQDLESDLSILEHDSSKIIRQIIITKNLNILGRKERETLALFILKQSMRTKDNRESLLLMGKMVKKHMAISEELDRKLNISIEELEGIIDDLDDEDEIKKVHKGMLSDDNLSRFVKPISKDLNWILYLNDTETPYLTSDNPVARFNPLDYQGNGGVLSRGINLYLPLNSKISLCLADPPNLYHKIPNNTVITLSDDRTINFQNVIQVIDSYRHIFSHNNDFSLVKEMIKNDPTLKLEKDRAGSYVSEFGDAVYESFNNIDRRLYGE